MKKKTTGWYPEWPKKRDVVVKGAHFPDQSWENISVSYQTRRRWRRPPIWKWPSNSFGLQGLSDLEQPLEVLPLSDFFQFENFHGWRCCLNWVVSDNSDNGHLRVWIGQVLRETTNSFCECDLICDLFKMIGTSLSYFNSKHWIPCLGKNTGNIFNISCVDRSSELPQERLIFSKTQFAMRGMCFNNVIVPFRTTPEIKSSSGQVLLVNETAKSQLRKTFRHLPVLEAR